MTAIKRHIGLFGQLFVGIEEVKTTADTDYCSGSGDCSVK
jgi:hypothetical protein